MREQWNEFDQETYLCTISDDVNRFLTFVLKIKQFVVDAKYRGNKARFINHGKNHANLIAKVIISSKFKLVC